MLNLRSKHITRFGSPLDRSMYAVFDIHGLVQMDVDLELLKLSVRGVPITSEIRSRIKNDVKQRRMEYDRKVDELGIPDEIKNLLLADSKTQVEQYAHKLTLSEHALFLLIHNCNQIQLSHRSKFRQYVPEHLKLSDTDRKQMKIGGDPKKALRKIGSSLLERRYIHIHLFESGLLWHLFYFSHQDIDEATNHWRYGPHLHYVSHLWPNLKKSLVWKEFNKRSTNISGSLHIKFKPFEFPTPYAETDDSENTSKPPKLVKMIAPNVSDGLGAVPLPVAQLATRGMWMGEVSFLHKK